MRKVKVIWKGQSGVVMGHGVMTNGVSYYTSKEQANKWVSHGVADIVKSKAPDNTKRGK